MALRVSPKEWEKRGPEMIGEKLPGPLHKSYEHLIRAFESNAYDHVRGLISDTQFSGRRRAVQNSLSKLFEEAKTALEQGTDEHGNVKESFIDNPENDALYILESIEVRQIKLADQQGARMPYRPSRQVG